ncbi:zinc ribbon domain-containing protein [Candidatus Dependentiae bacterium]|nr:zinc ribbon domain-containing protein [Candidatus Dependentiae bacterium]
MLKKIFVLFILSAVLLSLALTDINADSAKFKVCHNGHKNPDTAKYCVFCGLSLGEQPEPKKEIIFIKPAEKNTAVQEKKSYSAECSKCGKKFIDQKIKFCTVCGTKLNSQDIEKKIVNEKSNQNSYISKKENEIKPAADIQINQQSSSSATEIAEKNVDLKKYEELLKNGEHAYADKYYRIALQYFKEALKINEKGEDALFNSGVISYYMKNYSDANEYFEKLIAINNKDLDSLIYNGLSLYKLGLKEEAKDSFKRVLLISEKNSDYYKKAAEFFEKIK